MHSKAAGRERSCWLGVQSLQVQDEREHGDSTTKDPMDAFMHHLVGIRMSCLVEMLIPWSPEHRRQTCLVNRVTLRADKSSAKFR